MLTTYSHLKADDEYRREDLRDHYQARSTGRVGKAVAALVVAGAVALAACGTAVETETVDSDAAAPVVVTEAGPDTMTLEEKFSGVPAPDWHPKYGHLDLKQTAEQQSGPR